jgi:hypothetical protein
MACIAILFDLDKCSLSARFQLSGGWGVESRDSATAAFLLTEPPPRGDDPWRTRPSRVPPVAAVLAPLRNGAKTPGQALRRMPGG